MTFIRAAETALRRVHVRVKGEWLRAGEGLINPDGTVTQVWDAYAVDLQVLAANASSLVLGETLSQQSEHRVVYVRHAVSGLSPTRQKGADLLRFFGADWVVTQVLEAWDHDTWCKLLVTRYRDIPTDET